MKKYSIIFSFFLALNCVTGQYCPGNTGGGSTGGGTSAPGISSGSGSFNNSIVSMNSVNSLQTFNSIVSGNSVKTINDTYAKVDGSPYLTDEPVEGYVVLNNGQTIENIMLQVDAYKGYVIGVDKKGEKQYLDSRYFQEVGYSHDGEDFLFRKANPKKKDQFYEVLFNGTDLVFFKETHVSFREGHNDGMYKRDPKFNRRTNYYIKQEGEIAKVKLKKKEVFRQFPEFEHIAMNEYIKKHGIKLKGEKDFTNMFAGLYE